ncbi:hypothetical protein L6452_14030 [Arctium lappa]|uniref:Uncharacterized protein n=1 Tax=Arctium lappa TaxID=4217 RepID=A0ACB9CJU7_ARCLA|nr:hypothetical protein L6452_14030 [Arctium lappa]
MDQTVNFEDQVSITIDDGDVLKANYDSNAKVTVSSNNPQFGIFSDDRLLVQRLEEGNNDYEVLAMVVASINGGDVNIKYGWYGSSRDEINEVLLYGFRQFENRSSSYGRGVYLSPANLPMER